jgi:hypothetical protein
LSFNWTITVEKGGGIGHRGIVSFQAFRKGAEIRMTAREVLFEPTVHPLNVDPEAMREVMMSLDSVLKIAPLIASRAARLAWGQREDTQGQSVYEDFAKSQIEGNFRTVFEYAESPIERLFLSSLCMSFAMYDPFSAEFTPPINVETFLKGFHEEREVTHYLWKTYQEKTGSDNIVDFMHDVQAFFKTVLGAEEDAPARIIRHQLLYNTFGLYDGYHLTLQPQLENIRVSGKGIRPDLYIWLPGEPSFKLIIECDGFAHHSSRASFSNDRARDRILQQHGFQVFRFSGHEIYHNPAGKAYDLFVYLQGLRENGGQKTDIIPS